MNKPSESWYDYDFAALRLVPRVHRGEYRNIGILLYSPSSKFLAGRFIDPLQGLDDCMRQKLADPALFARYLRIFELIIGGEPAGGPIARLSQSQRFHWLTAPRSDIIQPTPIHHGRCRDLAGCVEELFTQFVL